MKIPIRKVRRHLTATSSHRHAPLDGIDSKVDTGTPSRFVRSLICVKNSGLHVAMPRNYWTPARIAQFEAMDAKNKAKHKHDEVTAEEQKERNALKSRRHYMFKKGGQLETIRAKLAEFGLEVVRLEDIRDDESTPPPSPDGSKRSDHPTPTSLAENPVHKAPTETCVCSCEVALWDRDRA